MTDNGQAPARLTKIDPGKLKLRELADVERQVGRRLAGELNSGELGMDTMQALLWVELRRHDPAATFEQAGEYDLETILAAFADDDEPQDGSVDPTPATPSVPATSASSPAGGSSKPTRPSTISGG